MADTASRRVRGLAVYDRPAHTAAGTGRQPVAILVHGSMDRAASFVKAARRVPSTGIVRYDRRGYGRSVAAGVADGIAGHVVDLVAVIDTLPSGTECVLVGHSFGGVIALAAAPARRDVVVAVGAFEAPMPWTSWWPATSAGNDAVGAASDAGPEAAAERFMRRMVGDDRWERLPAATRDARRAEGAALTSELAAMRSTAEPPYDLAAIDQPVVAGHGSESDPHHIEAARRLAQSARHGSLVVIDGARHGAHVSHPEAFASFVQTTLDAAVAARGKFPS